MEAGRTMAKPIVKISAMDAEMLQKAINCTQQAIFESSTEKDIAAHIKAAFEDIYPGTTWHCFCGRKFGCYVTHEAGKFAYFYLGQLGVCLFSTVS